MITKDFYLRDIEVGDRCIRYTGFTAGLEEVIVLGYDEKKGVKILNTLDKEVYTHGSKLFDLSAFERQIHSESLFNSLKSMDIKPFKRIVVSLKPNQLSVNEAQKMFKAIQVAFPDNEVLMVEGAEIKSEQED